MKTTATDEIAELLKRTKTIAVVGLSDSPLRPSYGVSAYMQGHGYRIIPVNPAIKGSLGEKAVASLSDIGEKIDIVDVFRRSEFVPEIVDEAIRLKAALKFSSPPFIARFISVYQFTMSCGENGPPVCGCQMMSLPPFALKADRSVLSTLSRSVSERGNAVLVPKMLAASVSKS